MNSLLLHNSKVPNVTVKKFKSEVRLVPNREQLANDTFDYDFFYDSELNIIFQDQQYDIIYISLNLSDHDYLELNGLRIAHHIRLSPKWKHTLVRIIFIGQESHIEIMKLNPLGSILLTPGVYLKNELIFEIDEAKNISSLDYTKYVDRTEIAPPSNYQSHHSISNEWALTRYFSMLIRDVGNEIYEELKLKVLALDYIKSLHFKYSDANSNRQAFKKKEHLYTPKIRNIDGKRIGVIDDEILKGWGTLYQYIFGESNAHSVLFTEFRKGDERGKLVEEINKWIFENYHSTYPITTFIIDLRMHDDDFGEKDFDNLSGVQIINYINSLNSGIPIVVSTASNKVWNYQKCIEIGVKYFAIKESPETFNTRNQTKQSLDNLCSQISKASETDFLADIYKKVQNLKINNWFLGNAGNEEFVNLVFSKNSFLDQIFNLLLLDSKNDAILNQCLLIAFQVLENYCDLNCIGSFGKNRAGLASGFIWEKNGTQLELFVNQSEQILTRLELTYGNYDFQIEDAGPTPISFRTFKNMELKSPFGSGIDATSIVKLISVLNFRNNISKDEIQKLLKLRYYRSNVAAHLTGNVKIDNSNKKIGPADIILFFDIFTKCFIDEDSL